jgi:DNA-directed RNA polymerase subunit H (RpoH/RPB5)
MFRKAEEVAATLSRSRALNEELPQIEFKKREVPSNFSALPSRLVQIERRSITVN